MPVIGWLGYRIVLVANTLLTGAFICLGVLSAVAASILVQLGRREGPAGPTAVVGES